MTTTSVKDVGSMSGFGVAPGNGAGRIAEESFQSVWDSQAGADRSNVGQGNSFENGVKSRDNVKPGEDLRAREHSRKDVGRKKAESVNDKSGMDELSKEELEQVAEVVGAAAGELIQQIADTFGVPVEAVLESMADMDLRPADLLQSDNLSNLLLQVSGPESGMTLLTNEQLYADYRMLMEQGRAMLEQCSEATQLSPEELVQATLQMQEGQEVANVSAEETVTDEPFVEITAVDEDQNNLVIQSGNTAQTQGTDDTATAEEGRKDGAGNRSSHQPDAGNTGNPAFQTIQNENPQPQADSVSAPTGTWSTGTRDMMRQIMDFMRIQVKPEVSSLEMQLHPASLGTLQIHVASKGGMLTANFITENETVKAALESQMVQLKESFAEQGVKVEAIEVTVQTHQFEQNLEQGRDGQSRQETDRAGRTRTRRIHLGDMDALEISEQLEAEDQITVQMMAANGQTVDYTA